MVISSPWLPRGDLWGSSLLLETESQRMHWPVASHGQVGLTVWGFLWLAGESGLSFRSDSRTAIVGHDKPYGISVGSWRTEAPHSTKHVHAGHVDRGQSTGTDGTKKFP